jgi:hypothetical protein
MIDFSKKPEKITPYNFGDTITRENFINFLVLSYALSRGNFVIQKVFFIMMEKNVGFQHESVVNSLYENGSFDAFSNEEQEIFVKAFRGVTKHLEKYIEMEVMDEIRDEIDGLYTRPKYNGERVLTEALNFFDFDKIKSVSDFTKTASEFNKRFEDSLN